MTVPLGRRLGRSPVPRRALRLPPLGGACCPRAAWQRPPTPAPSRQASPCPPTPLQLCSIHAKRVTIFVKDMQLARRLRGDRADDYS